MLVSRTIIITVAVAFAIAAPLGASAAATSSGVQPSTGAIAGTVTDQAGLPIAHVCVRTWGANGPVLVYTDATGHYEIDNLAPSVADDDEYSLSIDATCGNAPIDQDYEIDSVSSGLVYANQITVVDAQLTLGGAITGRVLDSNGAALTNVCVQATSSTAVGSAVSASDGTFVVPGLHAGSYNVLFEDCNGTLDVQASYYGDTLDPATAAVVGVAIGQTRSLSDQVLQPGGQIAIKVTDSAGNLISGLTPIAYPVNILAPNLKTNSTNRTADSSGYFHFDDLLSMPYYIVYWYCSPQGQCRQGPVGSYAGGRVGATPTILWVGSGDNQVLTDIATVPPLYPTALAVTPAAVSTTAGTGVTLSASVSNGPGAPVPTGAVLFTEGQSLLGSSYIDTNGTAQSTLLDLVVGVHVIDASYYGDGESGRATDQVTVTVESPASPGGGGGNGGGSGGSATGTVAAGGSLSSDPAGTKPDPSNPLVVGVTSPIGGPVTIDKTAPDTAIGNYRVLNVGATITAPQATVADPLKLSFQVADGALPAGSYASDLTVFRDGVAISQCTHAGIAAPDPCVTSASTSGGVTTIDILSSHASTWDVEAADVGRIAGSDRIATAVAVSQDSFPNGNAGAVVLARGDDYPDALVGAPLAAAKNAPLLLTQGATLSAATSAEISRVLPAGGTVYILGSDAAVPTAVATQLTNAGFHVVRYGGVDRFATAVAVADALGDPSTVLLATGTNFPDALAAGPAAAHIHGVVLLTDGSTVPAATAAYLSTHATTVYAIGGPAAKADGSATAVAGTDRFATAIAVATKFFTTPTTVGVATGATFPDALSGGAQLALTGSPLLLASKDGAPGATTGYLTAVGGSVATVHLYGGTPTLDDSVITQLLALTGGS